MKASNLIGVWETAMRGSKVVFAALCFIPLVCDAVVPLGDTQGLVAAVVSKPSASGEAFEVHFSSVTNDRWGCIQASGKIVVSQSAASVSADSFKRMFAIALAAQSSGKQLALDSDGSNPCARVTMAWMVG
jgi:hypothetical protein